jgi:deoxyhypusine synthase
MMERGKVSERVIPIQVRAGMTVNELVNEMRGSGSFGAGRIAQAVEIYERMIRDEATIFFGLAGAMVPAGMKKIVIDLMKKRMIDVLVSTGANMVHDALEGFGGSHVKGSMYADDAELHKKSIDRIYDIYVSEETFVSKFDKPILDVYRRISSRHGGETISIRDLMWEIGEQIPGTDSILRTAYELRIPVYVPALQDSCYGLSMWEYLFRLGEERIVVDAFADMRDLFQAYDKAKRRGAFIVGGGVPKNYIFQLAFKTGHPYDYVIQITMDRPETGGLSGATLEEAVSWGKIGEQANRVQVISDATICLPLIAAATLERLSR